MSYRPYTQETPLELNNINRKEGLTSITEMNTKLDQIKNQIGSFENKKKRILDNAGTGDESANLSNAIRSTLKKMKLNEGYEDMSLSERISLNAELQDDPNYNKLISPNGRERLNAADEIVNDNKLLNNATNQSYILGTIAVASLVILITQL